MLKNLPMVTSPEDKKEGEGEIILEEEEKNNALNNPKNKMDVIQELVALIEAVQSIGDFRRMQRKEAHSLVRRLKLLLPLLEEIRDIDTRIPEAGMTCLCNLKGAFLAAKKLLKMCTEGSKIYLALESEDVMIRFHSVYEKLNQALDGMPYTEIGISEEVKEQVELMRMQLRRAKKRTDTQDMELAMDMMVVLSTEDDRNADSASIERLANKLVLHTVEDLRTETVAVRKLVKERGQNTETNKQIVDILRKCKQIAGLEVTGILDDPAVPKALAKCPSLAVPNEFLCPITLEIMSDPVIVATGQTYERESIQKWLDSDHRTCPKTGQVLAHLSLAPNFALRNLILQWCEKNNFPLPKKEAPRSSDNSNVEQNNEIYSVVQNLSSNQLEVQRKAVRKIRMLSKENPENRILVANSGGIPPLVQLLSYPDSKIQEHAVTALLNLSIDESNKKLISKEQPIPAIVEIHCVSSVASATSNHRANKLPYISPQRVDSIHISLSLCSGAPRRSQEVASLRHARSKKGCETKELCVNQLAQGGQEHHIFSLVHIQALVYPSTCE